MAAASENEMTVFTVHQPLPRKTEDVAPPERFAFVRDGFYFWAFLLGPLWMFWNGLWLVLLIYLAERGSDPGRALGARRLRRREVCRGTPDRHSGRMRSRIAAALELRRRWTNVGLVVAPSQETAERRFFDRWSAVQHRRRRPLAPAASPRGCRNLRPTSSACSPSRKRVHDSAP